MSLRMRKRGEGGGGGQTSARIYIVTSFPTHAESPGSNETPHTHHHESSMHFAIGSAIHFKNYQHDNVGPKLQSEEGPKVAIKRTGGHLSTVGCAGVVWVWTPIQPG
jgi:hypothetical protein